MLSTVLVCQAFVINGYLNAKDFKENDNFALEMSNEVKYIFIYVLYCRARIRILLPTMNTEIEYSELILFVN